MLDYYDALKQLSQQVSLRRTKKVDLPLLECEGHYLAQDILAQYDAPQFDNSAMDGYALCLHDSDTYTVVARIAAGDVAKHVQLEPGQACRIFTGAPVPAGSDTVIMQEHTELNGSALRCTKAIAANQNIRRRGEDVRMSQTILSKGTQLSAGAIGLAASQGYAHLPVHAPLRVTVFSSGNELLDPATHQGPLPEGHIFNSNRYQTMALLKGLPCQLMDGGILPDNLEASKECLLEASQQSDLIITSGGVSVGEEDHLKNALEQIGKLTQWKLLIKPGKPFAWGEIGDCYVLMLPGNPVSAFVTFTILVKIAIKVIAGLPLQENPLAMLGALKAKANFTLHKTQERREFLRGYMGVNEQGEFVVTAYTSQGSHRLSVFSTANCLVEFKPKTPIMAGESVTVFPL